jgi:pimeloyl-ACP methyl ester carboxylesterase
MKATQLRRPLALLTLAGALSAAYQLLADAHDRRRFPPPGRLVDISGRYLHLIEAGEGSPAVVIIPALGDNVLLWDRIQRALAADTKVCVYDRPGLGWSDPPPSGRRTIAGMAAELRQLLDAAGIRPPYLLAAHSLGGLIARQFAVRNPGTVAGMVLIDSSHEQQATRAKAAGGLLPAWAGSLIQLARRRARWLGAYRLSVVLREAFGHAEDLTREVPAELAAPALAIWLSSCHRRAVIREFLVLATPQGQPPSLGSLPLTVLTATWDKTRTWETLQREIAVLSSNSRHVTAHGSGHYIHLDDPDLVVQAIWDQVENCRRSAAR